MNKPLIGFDVRALGEHAQAHKVRGIGRYVEELRKSLLELSRELPFEFQVLGEDDLSVSAGAQQILSLLPAGRRTLEKQCLAPLCQLKGHLRDFNLIHFPVHLEAPAWGLKKTVVTVLDVIPQLFENLYRKGQLGLRFQLARWLESQAARSAARVLTISEASARDISRVLRIPEEKITVTHLGVDPKFFKESEQGKCDEWRVRLELKGEKAPLILYIGGIDQRKNMTMLLSIFESSCEKRKQFSKPLPFLLMAGELSSESELPAFLKLKEKSPYGERVKLLGFVSDEELIELFHISDCFLYPSLYEGFGLPPLEALAAGCPVVSSNGGALSEVLGDAAFFFDPRTGVQDALEGLEQSFERNDQTRSIIEKGKKRSAQFTWANTAEKTASAYLQTMGINQK